MKLTIDSSVFLASLLSQDSFHRLSVEFLGQVRHFKIQVVLPILVPLEVANVLSRRNLPDSQVHEVFQRFYEVEAFEIIDLHRAFAQAFCRDIKNFDLKTSDSIIAQTALHFKTQLISWDQKLLRQVRGSQDPQDWLNEHP